MNMYITKLGNIAEIQTGPFGSQLHERDYVENGTPIITVEHLGNGRIIKSNIPCVSEIDTLRLKKFLLKKGDIVFSRVGSVDRSIIIGEEEDSWMFSGRCLRIRIKNEKILPLYLYYYFNQNSFKQYVLNNAVGATMPSLNSNILRRLIIKYPNMSTQLLIARTLSTIDYAILNNYKRIQLLEEAARLLYREWFVYFRFPGHENVKIVDGIPEGWKKIRLDQVWDINYGKNLSTSKIKKVGKFPVIGADAVIGYHDKKNVENSLCLVTCRGNGSGNIRRTYGPSFVTNNSFIFKSNDTFPHINFLITMFILENKQLKNYITGAAQPQLTLSNIKNIKVLIPEKKLILKYIEVAKDLIKNSDILKIQNQKLAQARDLLLPRLMSGKIDVSEFDNHNIPLESEVEKIVN